MNLRVISVAAALLLGSCAANRPYSAIHLQELAAHASEPLEVQGPTEAEEREVSEEPESEVGRQAFNIFVGGAIEDGDAEGYGIGIDYEYRATEDWGVGTFLERVDGIERSLAVGVQVYTRPLTETVLVVGLGGEEADGDWTLIGRVGVTYEFEIGENYFVAPGVFYDFGSDVSVVVYGLDVGYKW